MLDVTPTVQGGTNKCSTVSASYSSQTTNGFSPTPASAVRCVEQYVLETIGDKVWLDGVRPLVALFCSVQCADEWYPTER